MPYINDLILFGINYNVNWKQDKDYDLTHNTIGVAVK